MKHLTIVLLSLFIAQLSIAQSDIKMLSRSSSENTELRDILQFEGIDYLSLSFSGDELADKGFHLSVKEIWDGKVKSDSTIMDSKAIKFEQFQTINDSIFKMKVIAKHTFDNKLKMEFKFPRFATSREFEAIDSDDYSLRNVAQAEGTEIKYGERFYLLAYILPYENEGSKYWCAVESSGKDIENWGQEFGIKHYLVFEMLFE